MYMALALYPNLPASYGDIPDVLDSLDTGNFEYYELELEDAYLLSDYLVPFPHTRVPGALLDFGDVDYLHGETLAPLIAYLDEQLQRSDLPPRVIELEQKLRKFAIEAKHLGTGVVVEL